MPQATDPGLGINSWLEDELYHQYQFDRKSVDEGWTDLFQHGGHNGQVATPAEASSATTLAGTPAPPVEEPPKEESTRRRTACSSGPDSARGKQGQLSAASE